jgi:hypothetical protein
MTATFQNKLDVTINSSTVPSLQVMCAADMDRSPVKKPLLQQFRNG